MSMNKTRYARKKVLDHFLSMASYAFPTDVWLALFSADPTELGLLTDELTETGYARVALHSSLAVAVLATGTLTNQTDIVFGPATEDWSEITHVGIMDAATVGNMLYFGPTTTSRVVDLGDGFTIRAGQLTILER